jgi:hypothetical protein
LTGLVEKYMTAGWSHTRSRQVEVMIEDDLVGGKFLLRKKNITAVSTIPSLFPNAVQSNSNVEIMKSFISHGADVNARNNVGETPLHDVAMFLWYRVFYRAVQSYGLQRFGKRNLTIAALICHLCGKNPMAVTA